MSEALLVRKGGSGGLGFVVAAYPSAPTEAAKENSIGVVTNTPISGWVMQAEQPTGVDGLVWIEVAAESTVAFYADKKQQLKLYPKKVVQYVNGSWTRSDAYIYQSEWKQFSQTILALYWEGVEDSSTGGWTVSHGSKENTYIHVRITGETEARIYTTNKVNVGNYKTIFAEVSSPADNGLTFTVALNLRDSTAVNASSKATKSDTLSKGERKVLSIDISSMDGEFYPVVTTKTVGGSGYDLHRVWME